MQRTEVAKLVAELNAMWPTANAGPETADAWAEPLTDTSYATARAAMQSHLRTKQWPPSLAEILVGVKAHVTRDALALPAGDTVVTREEQRGHRLWESATDAQRDEFRDRARAELSQMFTDERDRMRADHPDAPKGDLGQRFRAWPQSMVDGHARVLMRGAWSGWKAPIEEAAA